MATTTTHGPIALASQSTKQDVQHNPRPYTPSPWGDFFLTHQPCTPAELLSMKEKAQARKEEVRRILLDAAASSDLARKLDLVDALQRLGVDYHYKKEIDELLRAVYDDKDGASDDLYVTSLRFYLLRKHGYTVCSDIFLKFRDNEGYIVSNDARCLLRLYDAAYLRVNGEEILDNIITFTKSLLQSIVEYLEPDLKEEVKFALKTPLFRRLKRVEARQYISIYEKKTTHNDVVLEFAKLDFNIILTLYCEELKDLTLWWKEFQTQANISSYARDRMVEMHFWMLGVFFEPQYSCSRKMLTQLFTMVSILDDLYDNYCTTEEGSVFLAALQRWDEEVAEQCPAYLRTLYINILTTVEAMEEELKLQKNKHAKLVKRLVIDMAKCYHAEVEWRDKKYVPATVEEHLKVSARSSGCMHLTSQAFISMGDLATTEAIEWVYTYPKIIRAVCIIARLANDIMSYKREQESKNMVSTVQACVKEYGVTIEQATEKLRELIEEAWMDITEECLRQPQPLTLLDRAVNLARTMDFLYKDVDGYTESYTIKDTLDSQYVDLIY
ncbi:(E)-beta-caryophyllene synthase-like [Phragmites australis]|uniref:(E)-beta-caryophyllene synthase-like n=1 Tax=Phragmites australis TaxID=29695 RepID=UPI002D77D910|nr:(E)-beta-caryophyllene synthase-like [Phragmites australis]